jgi:hypothetical protein
MSTSASVQTTVEFHPGEHDYGAVVSEAYWEITLQVYPDDCTPNPIKEMVVTKDWSDFPAHTLSREEAEGWLIEMVRHEYTPGFEKDEDYEVEFEGGIEFTDTHH